MEDPVKKYKKRIWALYIGMATVAVKGLQEAIKIGLL